METVEGACIELGDGYSTKKFACNVVCDVSLCGLVWSETFVWFGLWDLIEEVLTGEGMEILRAESRAYDEYCVHM